MNQACLSVISISYVFKTLVTKCITSEVAIDRMI